MKRRAIVLKWKSQHQGPSWWVERNFIMYYVVKQLYWLADNIFEWPDGQFYRGWAIMVCLMPESCEEGGKNWRGASWYHRWGISATRVKVKCKYMSLCLHCLYTSIRPWFHIPSLLLHSHQVLQTIQIHVVPDREDCLRNCTWYYVFETMQFFKLGFLV